MKLLFILVGATAAAIEPAAVELVGDGSKLIFDTGYIHNVGTVGLQVDSANDRDGNPITNGCTKIDDVCIASKLEEMDNDLDDLASGRVSHHRGNLTVHFQDDLSDAVQSLDDDIIEIEKLPAAIQARSDDLDSINATQIKILEKIKMYEDNITTLMSTTTTTTTTTTTKAPPAYGTAKSVPGRSCWDILGHTGGSADSGVYWVRSMYNHPTSEAIPIYCDMKRDGGGWALVQKGGTQGCFITSVGVVKSPTQAEPAKLSDAAINNLMGGHAGVSRWLHGSPNWKDYGGDAKNAAPAATKIFFRGKLESTTSTKHRPFYCGSTPSGTSLKTYDEDADAPKHWEAISGFSAHYGFDTFQRFGGRFQESTIRNCGVVEQEYLNVYGVDNRHCSGNHYCKDPKNFAGTLYKGLGAGYRGMGSYFIGCYGEYNRLPAETSGCDLPGSASCKPCKLGGKPGCLAPNMDSKICGAKAQMNDGYCNGINWDSHSHGGCADGSVAIDGGCHLCTFLNVTTNQFQLGCATDKNEETQFEWPELFTENMTMWVRPELPESKTFGTPRPGNEEICFHLDDIAQNRGNADKFCRGQGYARAQAAETAAGSGTSCQMVDGDDLWVTKSNQGPAAVETKGNRIVRIECVKH